MPKKEEGEQVVWTTAAGLGTLEILYDTQAHRHLLSVFISGIYVPYMLIPLPMQVRYGSACYGKVSWNACAMQYDLIVFLTYDTYAGLKITSPGVCQVVPCCHSYSPFHQDERLRTRRLDHHAAPDFFLAQQRSTFCRVPLYPELCG